MPSRVIHAVFPLFPMKRPTKAQVYAAGIFGAVSGALALYMARHPRLRKELSKSESAGEALQTLGDHVQKDSKRFADHLRAFLHADHAERDLIKKGKKRAKQAVSDTENAAHMAAAEAGASARKVIDEA